MNKNEQWADEVLKSLDGIQRAKPSNQLFDKINDQLKHEKRAKIVPLKRLSWVAVAAFVVITINIYIFKSGMQNNTRPQVSKSNLLNNYSIYDK